MKNSSSKKRRNYAGNEDFQERRGIAFITGRSGHSWERITAITICFTVVILLVVLIPRLMHMPMKSENAQKQLTSSATEYEKNAAALSEDVGFKVKELQSMPINLRSKTYEADGKVAVIYYKGLLNNITFRQAKLTKGSKKNTAADEEACTAYTKETKVVSRTGYDVVLKSTGQGYITAEWNDGKFAYTATGKNPFSERQIMEAVNSVV